MKKNYTVFIFILIAFVCSKVKAQQEWTGPTTTFTKNGGADWTLEANQDRITPNVWITRANNKGLFNIAQESSHQGNNGNGPSPVDTEWAFGSISDGVQNLNFTTWGVAHSDSGGGNPASLINQDMVVHLISEDIYINIKLLSWGGNAQNAPFSYERSTNNLSTATFNSPKLKLFPNPASNYILISGLEQNQSYRLFNILGKEIKNGLAVKNREINIQNLPKGTYFLKLDKGDTLKFIKH